MTTREYHADGLEFAFKAFTALVNNVSDDRPTDVMITNALEHIRVAAKFLRQEQDAFDVLFVRDDGL